MLSLCNNRDSLRRDTRCLARFGDRSSEELVSPRDEGAKDRAAGKVEGPPPRNDAPRGSRRSEYDIARAIRSYVDSLRYYFRFVYRAHTDALFRGYIRRVRARIDRSLFAERSVPPEPPRTSRYFAFTDRASRCTIILAGEDRRALDTDPRERGIERAQRGKEP